MSEPYFRDHIWVGGQCACGWAHEYREFKQHLYDVIYQVTQPDPWFLSSREWRG